MLLLDHVDDESKKFFCVMLLIAEPEPVSPELMDSYKSLNQRVRYSSDLMNENILNIDMRRHISREVDFKISK